MLKATASQASPIVATSFLSLAIVHFRSFGTSIGVWLFDYNVHLLVGLLEQHAIK